jgi:hypothetical protein
MAVLDLGAGLQVFGRKQDSWKRVWRRRKLILRFEICHFFCKKFLTIRMSMFSPLSLHFSHWTEICRSSSTRGERRALKIPSSAYLPQTALTCGELFAKGVFTLNNAIVSRDQGCQINLGPNIPNWEKYNKRPETKPKMLFHNRKKSFSGLCILKFYYIHIYI